MLCVDVELAAQFYVNDAVEPNTCVRILQVLLVTRTDAHDGLQHRISLARQLIRVLGVAARRTIGAVILHCKYPRLCAADAELTRGVLDSGVTAIAYETLEGPRGDLPCLTPMSEVAGRMSIQEGAKYLERPQEGRGILLGGVPGVMPANILILGGGVVGKNAAQIAAGFQADVVILDINVSRLRYLEDIMPANVNTLYSDRHNIREQLKLADLVIGAVLIPGARAPVLISREDLKLMKPGAVIIDVAVDQGGCTETCQATTHSDPTVIIDDIVHYGVTNMPGAVGRTSTYALCNVTFPYVAMIAGTGLSAATAKDPGLTKAVNMHAGKITNQAVADTFGLDFTEFVP
ncbi:MAG: alanine dehydrogenase [Planctomycetes bacterium]|nr:alanine dehydrogenase [Planctomycetota bacterium]